MEMYYDSHIGASQKLCYPNLPGLSFAQVMEMFYVRWKPVKPQIIMQQIQISRSHHISPEIFHKCQTATIVASFDSQCNSHHVIFIHGLSSLTGNVDFNEKDEESSGNLMSTT